MALPSSIEKLAGCELHESGTSQHAGDWDATGMTSTGRVEGDGGPRGYSRHVASLLREKLDAFIEGEPPSEKLRRILDIAVADNVVDPNAINPLIWSQLPNVLQMRIVACLPVKDLVYLRNLLTKDPTLKAEFDEACDDAKPNMAALLSFQGQSNKFLVKVFDSRKLEWLHSYDFRLRCARKVPDWFDRVGNQSVWEPVAEDGGLICFISSWQHSETDPMCVVVMNPLTHVRHELPRLQFEYVFPPALVRIKVDPKTKQYEVLVVSKLQTDGFNVESYDSMSGKWSIASPSTDRIVSRACIVLKRSGNSDYGLLVEYPCLYDVAKEQLEVFKPDHVFKLDKAVIRYYAIAKDQHVFVLYKREEPLGQPRHNREPLYFIREFEYESSPSTEEGSWVLVRGRKGWRIRSTEAVGTFKLCAGGGGLVCCRLQGQGYIFNLLDSATGTWYTLPDCGVAARNPAALTCQVLWSAVP